MTNPKPDDRGVSTTRTTPEGDEITTPGADTTPVEDSRAISRLNPEGAAPLAGNVEPDDDSDESELPKKS